jgi:hypothetical protein
MKKLVVLFLTIVFLTCAPPALAAKHRPPRGSGSSTSPTTPVRSSYSRGVQTSVKFRSDRRGLLLNFGNFGSAISVTYILTYTADGIAQGAQGTATPDTAGQQREVLFGTCSGGVCRWHSGITNARLIIESKLSSGVIIRKPYRIKI